MSARYQAPFTIPSEFPALLKGFTREVLRTQPEDIYAFGTQYFTELLAVNGVEGTDGSEPTPPSTAHVNQSHQHTPRQDQLQQSQHGGQNAGVSALDITQMSPQEVESFILGAALSCADLIVYLVQLRQILAEADENEDNVIQYREFLPIMVDVLQSLKAKQEAKAMQEESELAVRGEADTYLLHGLPKEEMQSQLLDVLKRGDHEGTGCLSYSDFKELLKTSGLGLTRKDINLILSQLDGGDVAYEEVVPKALEHMISLIKDEIVMSGILQSQDSMQGMLLSHFKAHDPEGSGLLSLHSVKNVLKDLSFQVLGLSTLQLMSIISQAPTTQEGMVQYIQFVPIATAMISHMYGADNMKLRLQAIREVAAGGGIQALSQMDIAGLRQLLEEAFTSVDTDGSGQLALDQVVEVLSNVGTLQVEGDGSQRFSDAHMRTMFAAIDVDESGYVDWYELVNFICDAIEHLEREAYIEQVAQSLGMPPIAEGSKEEVEQ
ncbi:radial spoke protein 7 [Dunaliella salina]|uniref:Radial spoke protein 7 n=1 Tax=Dunaliella salina TaxID=3046 RepID=A0ABQ7GCV4_DUNSA|nr:radial spoke protein 7 [Dunaliella salina]|eukprot:KAF5832445.1 radial spoke protein 7 [Dunaliella salina]